jgi:glycine cleavage system aminomethyltransferase T
MTDPAVEPNALDTPPTADVPALAYTPFHQLHVELGAKMVPFAGYHMPVQYPAELPPSTTRCGTRAACST